MALDKTRTVQVRRRRIISFLTKTKSEAELVTLFQSLRRVPGMKNFADDMQAYIVAFRSRRQNAALLKASVKPDEAFRLLILGIGPWLRYIKSYRELPGGVPFSDAQTVRFIIRERNYAGRTAYAATFESIKGVDDLKEFATKLQKELFAGWLRNNHTPELMKRHWRITHNFF
ncbi:hypothetical protein GQ600_1492 [Phytophthora cactorum]|nr:hypothetical protein GQ600_1492 [Phytophthora cactorum]